MLSEPFIVELQDRIDAFLGGEPHAVVGASANRSKYGNKVLRAYQRAGRPVFAVHPNEKKLEGQAVYRDLASLPQKGHGVSIITRPEVTERVVEQAGQLGIIHLWMQPGAQSDRCIAIAQEFVMNFIAGDACLLLASGLSQSSSTSDPYVQGEI